MRFLGLLILVMACGALPGCGGGDSTDEAGPDDRVADLTAPLPAASGYVTADISALKRAFDLPADADPMAAPSIVEWTAGSWLGLYLANPSKETVEALDLSAVTAIADVVTGEDDQPATALRTTADTSAIRRSLLDRGFVERDGILEGPDGLRADGFEAGGCASSVARPDSADRCEAKLSAERGLAVRIEDDVVLLSPDAETLTASSDDGEGGPFEIQSLLEGDVVVATGSRSDCIRQQGIATSPDGSGEMVGILDGPPEDVEVNPAPSTENGVGEPEVDGDVLTVPLDLPEPMPPRAFQADEFAGLACD